MGFSACWTVCTAWDCPAERRPIGSIEKPPRACLQILMYLGLRSILGDMWKISVPIFFLQLRVVYPEHSVSSLGGWDDFRPNCRFYRILRSRIVSITSNFHDHDPQGVFLVHSTYLNHVLSTIDLLMPPCSWGAQYETLTSEGFPFQFQASWLKHDICVYIQYMIWYVYML